MYQLYIIWFDGEIEKHNYKTLKKAQEIEHGYKIAFGNQIKYTSIGYLVRW